MDRLIRNAEQFRRVALAEGDAIRYRDQPDYALDWAGQVEPYLSEVAAQSVADARVMENVLAHTQYITTAALLHWIDTFVDILNSHDTARCLVLPMGGTEAHVAAPDKSNIWLALVAAQTLRFRYVADPACDLPAMRALVDADPDVEFLLFDDVMYSGRQTTGAVRGLRDAGLEHAYAVVPYVHHAAQIPAVVHPALRSVVAYLSRSLVTVADVAPLPYFADYPDRELLTLTYTQFKHPDSWSFPRGLLGADVTLPNSHVAPRWLVRGCDGQETDDNTCPPAVYKPRLRALAAASALPRPCAGGRARARAQPPARP